MIHVPTLDAREKHVPDAARLITNRYVTNYWEDTGIVGRLMQRALGVDEYIWDFYSIYDPQTVWSDEHQIPVPAFYQHQLSSLPIEKKLDGSAFAAKVEEFLARLPAASSVTRSASGT